MLAYRVRAEGLLRSLIDELPVLQKIKQGIAVSEDDLISLQSAILAQDSDLTLNN